MKEIKLGSRKYSNKSVLVDDEDFDRLNQFKWSVLKGRYTFYAVRVLKNKQMILMHREILGITDRDVFVDHKDQNGLNNQRENLRKANRSQNKANTKVYKNSKSQYLGVGSYKNSTKKPWIAYIQSNYKPIYLGVFEKEEDAALAYNSAAIKVHGEFANLNILKPI